MTTPTKVKSQNGWGIKRLGLKQKKLLQLMFDHGGRWGWDANNHLLSREQAVMESLVVKGFVGVGHTDHGRGVQTWHWKLMEDRVEELIERYGMKVRGA